MRRAAAGILSERGVQSAVDLCCGTGAQCRMLARRGLIARGVDASPSMLRQARLKQGPYEEYFLEDAAATRFADGSFDAALVSFALHEKGRSEQEAILAEARRIVRDKGLVLLIDFRPHSAASPPFGWLVRLAERGMGRPHYRHFKAFLQSGALPDLLSGQGLATLETRHFTLLPAELRLAANGC
jgi:ubiquinone/menaquinone biosynthesis C-methylase UbiE